MSDVQTTNRYEGITFSSSSVESVLCDIRTMQVSGVVPEYVTSFYAARPDWQDETTAQTNDQQETAQA